MANEWSDKAYNGGASPTTLNGGINNSVTSVTVTTGSLLGLDGSTGPFVITVDRTTLVASEEKMLVTARAGNVLTVQRGYDGTAAVSHLTLASVEHIMDAYSIEQANALAAAAALTGSMAYRSGAFAYTELPIGAAGKVVQSVGGVPAYGLVDLANLATALANLLMPAGVLSATIGATADTGHLMMDGSTYANAQTLYPSLWARLPAAAKSGSSFVSLDLRGRTIVGAGTGSGLTARTLYGVFGEENHALSVAELATHSHGITDPGHFHLIRNWYTDAVANGVGSGNGSNTLGVQTEVATTGVTVNNAGSGTAHNTMQPSAFFNWQIKAH